MSETKSLFDDVASMHPEDVPEPIKAAAHAVLRTTIATVNGRTFPDRETFERCLYLLAILTDEPRWDFLRVG